MLIFYLSLIDSPEGQSKFEKMYHEYGQLMKYIACGILKDSPLAEDAVHEAFMKIIRYLDKFEEIDCHKTKAYIVKVIESVSKDMLKKEKSHLILDVDSVDEMELAAFDSFDHIDIEELSYKIESLPKNYRDILELKAYFNCSDKELAGMLGITPATARKRLERARNALAKRLNEEVE